MSKKQVLQSLIVPYNAKREIICNGVVFLPLEISVFKIYSTTNKVLETSEFQNFSVDSEINKNGKEVTSKLLEEGKKFQSEKEISVHSNQIFIVHGHDSESKLELARMIE